MEQLTQLQAEFCKQMVYGPHAGRAARAYLDAGYQAKDLETAAAAASELMRRPAVQACLAVMYAERRAGLAPRARPWESLLSSAQALQLEVIEAARDAVAALRVPVTARPPAESPEAVLGPQGFTADAPDPDQVQPAGIDHAGALAPRGDREGEPDPMRPGLNPSLVTGPLVNLIAAGLKAAELVEAYAVGRPVTRTEQGPPGSFEDLTLTAAAAKVREFHELAEAAGLRHLLGAVAVPFEVAAPAVAELTPGQPSAPSAGPDSAPPSAP